MCCLTCIYFLFSIELFWSKKIKYNTFSLVLRSKSMFCENYFLPQGKNIRSITRYFHTFLCQVCFVFHLIKFFLKGFLVLSYLSKPAFEKSSKEKCKQINKSWYLWFNSNSLIPRLSIGTICPEDLLTQQTGIITSQYQYFHLNVLPNS